MLTLHHLLTSRSSRVIWLLEALGIEYQLVMHKRDQNMRAQADLAANSASGCALRLASFRHGAADASWACGLYASFAAGKMPLFLGLVLIGLQIGHRRFSLQLFRLRLLRLLSLTVRFHLTFGHGGVHSFWLRHRL
jgi:hypothetical protein